MSIYQKTKHNPNNNNYLDYCIGYDKTLKGGNVTLRDIGGCIVLCCLGFIFCYTVRDFITVCVLVGGLEFFLLSVCWLVVRIFYYCLVVRILLLFV